MKMKEARPLFFIALIPPDPLRGRITELKVAFANQYNARHALKSPPHVTLVPPFRADKAQMEHLCRQLKIIAKKAYKFELQVKGYGAFKPRVIYLDVPEKQEAMVLRQKLLSLVMPEEQGKKGKLHITLAARDLSVEMFLKAWEANKDQPFITSFVVDSVYLLKHDGAKWHFYKEFGLNSDAI